MGTKVQFKSYIPIHNAIRNRDEHSSNNWPCYYRDDVSSDHLYDGSLLREANGYSLCDKEMLKLTMLEHEATFTKQVSELHRLYRIQKELMNELKNREKIKLCSTFQTNLFTSHMSSKELRQKLHLSALSSHVTVANAMELSLKYLKESGTKFFEMPVEAASSSSNYLGPITINLPRKKLDLHLPAEVYIYMDEDTVTEKHENNEDSDNNAKPSLRSKDDGSMNGSSRLHIHQENVSSRVVLADLNEPLKSLSHDEGEVLTFSQVIGSTMKNEEIMRHQIHSNKISLSRDFFPGNHGQGQTVSNSVNSDKVESFQEWPSSTNESGENRSTGNGSHGVLCDGEFSVIPQPVKEKPKNCAEFVLPVRSKSRKWMGETSNGTSKLPNLNSSESDSDETEQSASQLMSLMSDPNAVASSVNEQKNGKQGSTSICPLLDSSSSLHVMERNEASCNPSGETILQFPSSSQSTGQGAACDLSSVDISNKVNMISSASCIDALNSLEILPKYELPSSLSAANILTKVEPMIDLEEPLDAEVEKAIATAEEESKQLNCNLIIADREGDLQLTDGSHETLIKEAADNLVAMSSHDHTCPSIPTFFDTLHWFVDFAILHEVSTGISIEKSRLYDGLDMFECTTLKLKEIEEDEFFYKLHENQNNDGTGDAALLPLSRSQRGLARKRRQRRDFQKDILPGLASLSRLEISEDLQSFGGMMRPSGKSWKAGLSRRSSIGKASNWKTRGRRRPRNLLAISVTEVKICSSQKENANGKREISTTGILGWGRRTRRCRRPRLLPGRFSVSPARRIHK